MAVAEAVESASIASDVEDNDKFLITERSVRAEDVPLLRDLTLSAYRYHLRVRRPRSCLELLTTLEERLVYHLNTQGTTWVRCALRNEDERIPRRRSQALQNTNPGAKQKIPLPPPESRR